MVWVAPSPPTFQVPLLPVENRIGEKRTMVSPLAPAHRRGPFLYLRASGWITSPQRSLSPQRRWPPAGVGRGNDPVSVRRQANERASGSRSARKTSRTSTRVVIAIPLPSRSRQIGRRFGFMQTSHKLSCDVHYFFAALFLTGPRPVSFWKSLKKVRTPLPIDPSSLR